MMSARYVLGIQTSIGESDLTSANFFTSWLLVLCCYTAPRFERFRWPKILSLVYYATFCNNSYLFQKIFWCLQKSWSLLTPNSSMLHHQSLGMRQGRQLANVILGDFHLLWWPTKTVELRQYKNDSTETKNRLVLKLSRSSFKTFFEAT